MELHVSLRKEQMTGVSWLLCLHRSDRTSEVVRCPGTDYLRKRADRDPSLPGPPVHWAWVVCRPALFRARSPVCRFSGKPPMATVDDSPETGAQEKRACSKPTRTVTAADGDGGLHTWPAQGGPAVPWSQAGRKWEVAIVFPKPLGVLSKGSSSCQRGRAPRALQGPQP